MKTTTKFAIAAAVTALMGSSALAADLGGSCCADLEERIAELEATTVRKGNRKVSVQISGFVGHQVMWWDDGSQSDMYIGDGGNIFSRWRLRGEAKINPELSAGFLYEFGVNNNAIGSMNQGNGGDDLGESGPSNLRDSTVWLKHSRLGMVKIGHGSTATDNLVLIDLANRSAAGTPDIALYMGGFQLRATDGFFLPNSWGQAIRGHESWDTSRRNHVLYETPSLAGFSVQAAVAEDNYWDVALRYAGEFNGVRVAFGIGYQEDSEFNRPISGLAPGTFSVVCTNTCDAKTSEWKGSASILHVPTGLFLTGAAGTRELEGLRTAGAAATAYTGPDLTFWHLSGGVAKNFFGIGNTVLFGEYSKSEGGLEQADFLGGTAPRWTGTETTHWGIGVNQYVDAAAMQIFATYKSFEFDGVLNGGRESADFQTFIVGSRIDF
ncbi:MAG: porin [Hyphomicrobiaceae bacterium]